MRRNVTRSLVRNLAWIVGGDVAIKLALAAVGLLVGRFLGAAALGTFSLGYGAAMIATAILSCGQVETLIREVARRPRAAADLLGRALALETRMALALGPPALLALLLVGDRELAWTLAGFGGYAVLRARMITRAAPFKGLDRMEVEVQGRWLESAVVLLGVGAIVAFALPVAATGVVFLCGGLASQAWLRHRSASLPAEETAPEVALIAEGWPFLVHGLVFQLLLRGDLFLLELLGRERAEVGLYAAAGTLVWGLLAAPQALSLAVYPLLSRRAGAAGAESRRVVLGLAALGGGFGGLVALGLAAFSQPLVELAFGTKLAGAGALLARLAWAFPGACTAMILGIVLAAQGRQRTSLALGLVAVVGLAVADGLLVAGGGALAAAGVAVAVHTAIALAQLAVLLLGPVPAEVRPVPAA
jgi:O-antigen/teichoic acid export membrane protein